MKRAISIPNLLNTKFKSMPFEGKWADSFGCPEPTGCFMIYGEVKQGKTDFAMQLAKYLTQFGRVQYNSVEEGLSLSLQNAIRRNEMSEVSGKIIITDKEEYWELKERLVKRHSPRIVFIDSIQMWDFTYSNYLELKSEFKSKLFVFISHTKHKIPQGSTAERINRDAHVSIRVEGFKAFVISRYGGGAPFVINQEYADQYWCDK
jgi:hypothetical protein